MQTSRSNRSLRRPGWIGFGLIGLLLVMAIILYLMFGAGGGYMQQVGKTRQSGRELVVDINTRDLLTLIANYQVTNGKLPHSIADLEAGPGVFRDPWGTELTFSYENEHADPVVVIVTSAGPDTEFGTDDDIVKHDPLPF
jgi:type II secretory pathway pseudopilin PulG